MHITLIVPISPRHVGTGLSNRVRHWVDFCSRIATLTTVVVPVAGRAENGDIVVTPGPDRDDSLPRLARGLTREHGRSHSHLAIEADLVIAVRSYLGEFAIGMACGAPVLVDLDDDDADYFSQRGDHLEAERFRGLVAQLRETATALVSADGFGGTVRVANTVDFPATPNRSRVDEATVLIVGNFGYEPNAEGATWFLTEVAPLVRRTMPNLEVRVVGPGSERLGPEGKGFIDDLSTEYARATVCVAPVLTGSGTRTKIIEAWAHRVPVVSTLVGAHGLATTSGEQLLIGDSPDDMASSTVRLLTDHSLATSVGTSGWEFARANFHPDVVAAEVTQLVTSLASPRRRVLLARTGLEVTETDDGIVVFDPDTDVVHHLNPTAAVIFLMSDGTMDIDEVSREVADVFGLETSPRTVVGEAVSNLVRARLIVVTTDAN